MIKGVIASLIAMGIGHGLDSACKIFNLNNTLEADFRQAYDRAINNWAKNESAREKFKQKEYIFRELIKVSYNAKYIDNLDIELKSLLEEFNKTVCEYENLSRYIEQTLLRELAKVLLHISNLYITAEGYLNLEKNNQITKQIIEKERPNIFYKRRFLLEENATVKEKKYYDADIETSFLRGKRNLYYGEGGLGKSTYLKTLGSCFIEENNNYCIYLDAKNYDSCHLDSLDINSDKLSCYLYHLGKCFDYELRELELDTFLLPKESEQYNKYIIIDGINEIPTNQERKKILTSLDNIHSKFNVTIICSSRYKDGYNFNSWQRFKTKSISEDELKNIITKYTSHDYNNLNDKNRTYLRIPFFLDKAIKQNDFIIESYSGFIEKHLMNSERDNEKKTQIINVLSEVAIEAYEKKNISNISYSRLSKLPQNISIDELIEKNIIYHTDSEQYFKFEHQLIVDLLVSHLLSKKPELWNKETFDTITLGSNSSWEVMQMILEQVESEEHGTKFLLSLYNWNYYAVLWCLKFVDKTKYNKIDAIAIILIVAEKLLDKFKHTQESVYRYIKDLPRIFEINGIESELIKNKDYASFLKSNINRFKGNVEYESFFYEMINTKKLNYETIEKIVTEPNPAKAWGYSNMFKRCQLTKENETQLKAYFHNADKLVQWRIVHSLGIAKRKNTITFLLNKIEFDEYPWVSYGAIRSLIEIYYYTNTRTNIIKELLKENILNKILNNVSLSKELRNCLTYSPNDKKETVIKSFEKIIQDNSNIFDERIGEKAEWVKAYNKLKANGTK